MNQGIRQLSHFENLHSHYERHQYHPSVMEYRRRFIYEPMFSGLDLNGAQVIDICSGSGHSSLYLKNLFPQISLTGLDISPSACAEYERRVRAPCKQIDLTVPNRNWSEVFDVAFIVGGLHHCVANLETTVTNIAKLVKPGGKLLMVEPSVHFFANPVRKIWYRFDKRIFDAKTERALGPDEVLTLASGAFKMDSVVFFGGPACAFVMNGMVFRIPLMAKSIIAPFLMNIEETWNRLPWKSSFFLFLAKLIRT